MSSPSFSGPALRLLGLDFGEARIGVAATDALGLLAHPVETVAALPRAEALARIGALCRERQAGGVVVGLPIRQDGTEGRAAVKIRDFATSLLPHLPAGTVLHFQDEYGSTQAAAAQLQAAGKRSKSHRPIIDQAAAVVILQDFLDAQLPPLEPGT